MRPKARIALLARALQADLLLTVVALPGTAFAQGPRPETAAAATHGSVAVLEETTAASEAQQEEREGMRFTSEEEALNWIADRAQALNLGEVSWEYDDAGYLRSVLITTVDKDPAARTQAHQALLNELGGTQGYVEVAGEWISLAQQGATESSSETKCSDDGEFCTENKSFIRNYFFTQEVGASTVITRGGVDCEKVCFDPPLYEIIGPLCYCTVVHVGTALSIAATIFTHGIDPWHKPIPITYLQGYFIDSPYDSLGVITSRWCINCKHSSPYKGICSFHGASNTLKKGTKAYTCYGSVPPDAVP